MGTDKMPVYVFKVAGEVTVVGEYDENDAREVGQAYLDNLGDLDAVLGDVVDTYSVGSED